VRTLVLRALILPGLLAALLLVTTSSGSAAPAAPAASSSVARAASASPCSQTAYVWAHLSGCGHFGPTNTGPDLASCPGHRLVPLGSGFSSRIVLRTAGSTLQCRDVRGCLSVRAAGVKITNVKVRCDSGKRGSAADGTSAVAIERGASASLHRVRIDGMRGVHACIWHMGTRASMNRIDCSGANDGVFSWGTPGRSDGGHFSLTNSYLHDFTTRTSNGHVDGFQTEGSSNGVIRKNTFLMTTDAGSTRANSAIAVWDGRRDATDYTISDNLIAGGGFSVYAHDYSPSDANPAGGYSVTRIRFVDNVFSRRLFGCVGSWGVWFPRGRPTDGWRRSGNRVLETRADIDRRNPTSNGHPCV
jgi:hypothetical protein